MRLKGIQSHLKLSLLIIYQLTLSSIQQPQTNIREFCREAVGANGCQWVQMGANEKIQIPLGAYGCKLTGLAHFGCK